MFKTGFKFGMGFMLAQYVGSIPAALMDPRFEKNRKRLKRNIERLKNAIAKERQTAKPAEFEVDGAAFPQCQSKIGFATE